MDVREARAWNSLASPVGVVLQEAVGTVTYGAATEIDQVRCRDKCRASKRRDIDASLARLSVSLLRFVPFAPVALKPRARGLTITPVSARFAFRAGGRGRGATMLEEGIDHLEDGALLGGGAVGELLCGVNARAKIPRCDRLKLPTLVHCSAGLGTEVGRSSPARRFSLSR